MTMAKGLHSQMGETWPRFFCHWIAACFGHFFHVLLPLVTDFSEQAHPVPFPRWWAVLGFAAGTSISAAIINANLPVTARELVKSCAMGFALNVTSEILWP